MDTVSWEDLRILLALYRSGSLLKAGQVLGMSTSTVGRRIDALEAAMGAKLVRRTASGTHLEDGALALVELALDLDNGLRVLHRDQHDIAGKVRISAPDGMAAMVGQALHEFLRTFPGIEVELVGENRMADVAKREADIALRLVRSTSSVLIEKHVSTLRFGLYGSKDFVERNIVGGLFLPQHADYIPFIGLDSQWKDLPHERWMTQLGAKLFPFRSSSYPAILEAVRRGLGVTAVPEHGSLTGGLMRISTSKPSPTQPVYLVYHRDLRRAKHVRSAVSAIESFIRNSN